MPTIDILGVPHVYALTAPSSQSSTPVLVFVHGWLLSRQYWLPLIEQLAPNYQCLTYDLRGFGDSQLPATEPPVAASTMLVAQNRNVDTQRICRSSYTLAAYAQDLQILLQKLDIDHAWLIGHSLGGSIALWGAKRCPTTVKGVICLNAGGGIYLKEEFERFRRVGQQLLQWRPFWLPYIPLIDRFFARNMVAHPLDKCWGRQRVVDYIKARADAALGSLLDSTTEAEVHLLPQIVSRLPQPVYFLAGQEDKVMEPQYVRYLASFHPLFDVQGNNVLEIPNCGHLAMVEQPQLVGEKILKILIQHGEL